MKFILASSLVLCLITPIALATGPQQCYFGPGAANRADSSVVPCLNTGESACCMLGDTCLSGNACYNNERGDTYQYGCTDITYTSSVCPYKCGWNTTLSPWTALEYCNDLRGVNDTWACHAPESCGCEWNASSALLVLSLRGCKEMGASARVALYAPPELAPYVSLPSTFGGETTYYSPTVVSGTESWVQTAIVGYTPATVKPLTTYQAAPTTVVEILPGQAESASTASAAHSYTPTPSSASAAPTSVASSSPTVQATSSASIPSSGTESMPSITASTSPSPSVASLSTGAKAGIGVGAAGGVCLLAALGVIFLLWRKRHRRQIEDHKQQQEQHPSFPPDAQISPPLQSPPYFSQDPKADWPQISYPQGFAPTGSPQMPNYFDANMNPASPYHGGFPPSMVFADSAKIPTSPQPLELSAERGRYEIGEDVSSISLHSPMPTPTYVETEAPRK